MAQITRDHIQFGATIIDYDIEFAQRKTLSICVNPDSSVCLMAAYRRNLGTDSTESAQKSQLDSQTKTVL